MTFVPHTKNKRCFTACPEHKIKSGLCHCINRIKFKGNDNIDAVSGWCGKLNENEKSKNN